jgi:hypothetical protein
VRIRHRAVGDVLLAVGVAPAVVVIWFWPVAVVALTVVVCAVTDLADVRTLRRPGPFGRFTAVALVVAVLGTGVAWIAMLSVGGWVTVLVAGVALVALLALVVALGRTPGSPESPVRCGPSAARDPAGTGTEAPGAALGPLLPVPPPGEKPVTPGRRAAALRASIAFHPPTSTRSLHR